MNKDTGMLDLKVKKDTNRMNYLEFYLFFLSFFSEENVYVNVYVKGQ